MSLSEFQLIEKYFAGNFAHCADVIVGIGDDAAVIDITCRQQLVVSVDTSIVDVHFPSTAAADDIGYRCLAVNLSDLAAMGAEPGYFTLALTLPDVDESWLAAFSAGMQSLAREHKIALVGGDTTRGTLSVTIQVHGYVQKDCYLGRAGAKPGDLIYVSGNLGDAAAGLQLFQQFRNDYSASEQYLIERYLRPTPRVALGLALSGVANSCIDISDGLLADLGHISKASACEARVDIDSLPISAALQTSASQQQAIAWALQGGDDYELCFSVPPQHCASLEAISEKLRLPCHCIGKITAETRLADKKRVHCFYRDESGKEQAYQSQTDGYRHF
jgi:thiamine-monophosphate kinase